MRRATRQVHWLPLLALGVLLSGHADAEKPSTPTTELALKIKGWHCDG